MQKKIKVGIVGAAGYTGGELIRLLIHHPNTELVFANSKSNFGKKIVDVHTDLLGDTEMEFSEQLNSNTDVLFLCLGHGESKKFLAENEIPTSIKIIDLSQDFRIQSPTSNLQYLEFIYGLPELNRDKIKNSNFNIANPGCFATCIQLALLPLANAGLIKDEVHVSATTGSTGAGQSMSETSHFSWRNNNLSTYKNFEHQHLLEINQSIKQLQNDFDEEINFIPHRGNFTRGIFATVFTECDLGENDAIKLYENYYVEHPFVHISKKNIDMKQVLNTNKCFLYIEKKGNKIIVTSIIDNLLKGASGQAVQNMNLLFGLEETEGLNLKPSAF
jgi:N-acetyl-gamma-glutamyl-phosphate reductase